MEINAILVWPRHLDYPLWRAKLPTFRNRLEKVVIVFSDMGTVDDYRNFVKEELKHQNVTFIDSRRAEAGEDWRNNATNLGLVHIKGDWVWFTEPDFIITDPGSFWDFVKEGLKYPADAFIYLEGDRPHPACWFTKREALEGTRKNFSVIPDQADHFWLIHHDLEANGAGISYFSAKDSFYHLNGLSQNMHLLKTEGVPNFRPERFWQYVQDCWDCGVKLHPDFISLTQKYVSHQ